MTIKELLKAQIFAVKRPLALAVGLSLGGGILMIVQAWLLALIVSAVLFDQAENDDVWTFLLILPAIFVLRALATFAAERVSFEAAAQVKQRMRRELQHHLSRLGPVRLAGEGAGDLVNMINDGVEALEAYYARYLPGMALMVLIPCAVLVVVLPNDWVSALVMAVTAPLIPVFMIFIGKGAEKLNQRQWRKLARMSTHFLDMIQGLTTLKIFGASRREAAAIAHMSEDYRRSTMAVLRVAFLSSLALEFFATVSIAIVAVLIGFRLLSGDMEFFHGFLVLLLAPEFYLPLRQMGANYHARMAAIGAAERMVEILSMPVVEHTTTDDRVNDGPHTFVLRARNVHFAYDDDRSALNGINFTIVPGERVALVGPSGSGKSTVFNLLLGFIEPQRGDILLNDTPLNGIDLDDWRQRLSYVPQNPTLFHGTIADNIRLGSPNAPLDAVQRAAHAAHAADFIEDLPARYDTLVGERGHNFSGGEIQRIALARALLRDAPLLLLDEPTASLDLESEDLITRAIDEISHTRTVITIAHRLDTVRQADRILVFDQGRIVEQGNHDALCNHGGLYAHLAGIYGAATQRWKDGS